MNIIGDPFPSSTSAQIDQIMDIAHKKAKEGLDKTLNQAHKAIRDALIEWNGQARLDLIAAYDSLSEAIK